MKLEKFREELRITIREEIRSLKTEQPTWLRSSQVRKMLKISDSTLQTLRVSGTIPAYKLGTTWLYKYDEIINELEANKIKGKEANYE